MPEQSSNGALSRIPLTLSCSSQSELLLGNVLLLSITWGVMQHKDFEMLLQPAGRQTYKRGDVCAAIFIKFFIPKPALDKCWINQSACFTHTGPEEKILRGGGHQVLHKPLGCTVTHNAGPTLEHDISK